MIHVIIYHLRPERPFMRAKSLHDIRVRWHAGRDRWFDNLGELNIRPGMSGDGLLEQAVQLFNRSVDGTPVRAIFNGDVLVVADAAYCCLPDGTFRRIDEGLVVPASDPGAAADLGVTL